MDSNKHYFVRFKKNYRVIDTEMDNPDHEMLYFTFEKAISVISVYLFSSQSIIIQEEMLFLSINYVFSISKTECANDIFSTYTTMKG